MQINAPDLLLQPQAKVETDRYTSEARHERTCHLFKSATATEDDQHILLQCPQLDDLRDAHIHLVQTSGQTLTDLFDDHPPMLLAKYVRAALLINQSVLLLPLCYKSIVDPGL